MNSDAGIKSIIKKMSLEEKALMCAGTGSWHTDAIPRLGVDSVMMTDGPHGVRRELNEDSLLSKSAPATCFPSAATLACGYDRELMEQVGAALGAEAREQGVSMLLGPGVNIKRSPLCGRNFEYFSEDPFVAGELAAPLIDGIQSTGAGACIKHYCCNNQEKKRFICDSRVDERALHEIYLEAFRIAIKKSKPFAVMSSYNHTNGEYSGESEKLIKKTLRGEFGFDGMVVSDWGAVSDRVAGIRAGLDLEMPGKTAERSKEIIAAIKNGSLKESALDECVGHILGFVRRCCAAPAAPRCDYNDNSALARTASEKCAVLLKNDGGLLPLEDKKPFAVIGNFAKNARYQGAGSSIINPTSMRSALEELDSLGVDYDFAGGYNMDGSTDDALISEACDAARLSGRAVIFAGLPDAYESEGFDRDNMDMPAGMLRLIDAVCSCCEKVAVVLMLGAPVVLPFAQRAKSILCMYLGGQNAGAAAARLIIGKANPSGSLAESWPKKLSDVPCYAYYDKNRRICEYREGIYVGYRYYEGAGVPVEFKFAHGLSYTTFSFENASLSKKRITDGETIKLRATLKNTGARAGAKTVFVFVSEKDSAVKQLKGFAKLSLEPGEEKRVSIELPFEAFCYYDPKTGRRAATGAQTVYAGLSLDELSFCADVSVEPQRPKKPAAYFGAKQAAALPDDIFYALTDKCPEPDKKPYTLNSTLSDISGTLAGKIMRSVVNKTMNADGEDLNEANRAMNERAMDDMPLRALCALSGGAFPRNFADAVVALANGKLLRGIGYVLKK